jgi:hypothetical protein
MKFVKATSLGCVYLVAAGCGLTACSGDGQLAGGHGEVGAGEEGVSPSAASAEPLDDWGPGVEATDVVVAEVELSNGDRLGWYELSPGILLMGQSENFANGPQTDYDPETAKELLPSELYQQLVPDAAVPSELLEAEFRALELVQSSDIHNRPAPDSQQFFDVDGFGSDVLERTDSLGEELPDGVGQVQQAVVDDSAYPWTEYEQKIQCADWRTWTVRWHHQGGDSWFKRVENDASDVGAGVYAGTVTYRVRVNVWSWDTPVNVTLSPGEGWHWSRSNYFVDHIVESKVTNSSGDGYHHCGSGWR